MVAYRKLDSGLWQATVYLPQRLPGGRQRRVTRTNALKGNVRKWGEKLEAQIAAGQFTDPRSGDITLADWRAEWSASRIAAGSTTRKDDSHWRVHVEPRYGGHPINTITTRDLAVWVHEMSTRQCRICRACPPVRGGVLASHRLGTEKCSATGTPPGLHPTTVRGAVSALSAMLSAAVRAQLLPANPAVGLRLPRVDAKPIMFWTHEDADKILSELDGLSRTMVDLDLHCGLRLGELLGLKVRYVQETKSVSPQNEEIERLLIHVVGVQTRDGWRDHPKSGTSRRTVPVPPHLTEPLREAIAGKGADDIVFSAPGGFAWDDRNWSRRVFNPAVTAAGVKHGSAHDMRHTAASWLVQAGVDLYVVQALLGHESFRTTQRYAHLAPESFDKVLQAWQGFPEI